MQGSGYCYNHEPSKAIERREAAIRAGRSGGRGRPRVRSKELAEVKQGVRSVILGLHSGELDKGSAAVLFQGFNVLLRAVEMEHEARKEEERARQLEEHFAEVDRLKASVPPPGYMIFEEHDEALPSPEVQALLDEYVNTLPEGAHGK
jgi:hypothetical protein